MLVEVKKKAEKKRVIHVCELYVDEYVKGSWDLRREKKIRPYERMNEWIVKWGGGRQKRKKTIK